MNDNNISLISTDNLKIIKELLDIIDTDNRVFNNTKKLILKIENDKLDNKKKD